MIPSIAYCIAIFLSGVGFSCGFSVIFPPLHCARIQPQLIVLYAKDDKSYQFGDITRGLIKKATSAINEVTGKDEYKVGDLSRWADSQIKGKINKVTKQDEYRFGDLTRWADAQAKAKVAEYTGKEEYTVGDISKEIIRRIGTGEYKTEDVLLLCKMLLTFGAGLTPVASFLPAKLLLEMMEVGIAQEVGGRLLGALATTLDERFKETITGDPNYRIGDKTKQAVLNVMAMANDKNDEKPKSSSTMNEMNDALIAELEDWDRRFGIAKGTTDTQAGDSSTTKA